MSIAFVGSYSPIGGIGPKEERISEEARRSRQNSSGSWDSPPANHGSIVGEESAEAVNNLFAHLAVIDEATRQEIEDMIGDDESYIELIQQFLSEGGLWLDRLDKAVAAADVAGLCRISHTLKGSCATIGVVRITSMLAKVEEAARAGYVDHRLTVRLRVEWEQVREYLRPWGMHGTFS